MPAAWQPPPALWVKFNVDGSCIPSSSLCSAGGVVRDPAGAWLLGFMSKTGHGDPLLAELSAIKQGLSLCWQKGYRRVLCESDCGSAISVLQNKGAGALPVYSPEIAASLQLLSLDWEVSLLVAPRFCNSVADKLANLAHGSHCPFVYFDSPPPAVLSFLASDRGIS